MVTVEQLYKDFGVLADAKDKAGEVICRIWKEHLFQISITFDEMKMKPRRKAYSKLLLTVNPSYFFVFVYNAFGFIYKQSSPCAVNNRIAYM